jgi:ABC-type transport system involved in multi-copper enzyme maturation permease subunit
MTMVLEITLKEIQENFRTVRFYLILLLTLSLFLAGSLLFVRTYDQKISDYRKDITDNENLLRNSSQRLLDLAKYGQSLYKRVNPCEFISEANEKYLPNKFETTIYRAEFPELKGRGNVLLRDYESLDWDVIVAVVLSFLAFILSYDAVCGEKEQKTLALMFSNPVRTSQVFLGKFLGLLISLGIPLLIGIVLGLSIINLLAGVTLDIGRIMLFICASFLYLSLFLLIGMTVSSLVTQSVTSAIILLFVWVITAFIIPASGNLIANKLYPLPTRSQIKKEMSQAEDDIYKTKYAKTQAGRWDGRLDQPWVPLRSQWMADILDVRNKIYDDYLQRLILQVQRTKDVTKISPVSVFRSLTEEISGSGVLRFQNFYGQVNRYKNQLYQFVESVDKADPKSVHLIPLAYSMYVGISNKPVDFSLVPKFEERLPSVKDNLKRIIIDSAMLVFLSILFFYLGYFLFVRYDKR